MKIIQKYLDEQKPVLDPNKNPLVTKEDIDDHHGISAIVRNKNNELLMFKHVKYGFWTIPVGKVKDKQSVVDGLKEELFEETGVRPKKFKEVDRHVNYYQRTSKIKTKVIAHLFDIIEYSGTPKNMEPKKHSKMIWMSLDEIKKLNEISDATNYAIDYIENQHSTH